MPALLMVAISFVIAAIGVATLLQARQSQANGYALGCGAVLLPPLVYAIWA